ncbi:unnamed protein product [Prorocentrum cordatum]|uniref:Heterokaryon incompatibility domain-containing protein n=1 Tax=Prorocentrum cordatum TaxID=2364126 RepID=A0ABN9X4Q4_9DINO|nr:unnamed protein product [Polarella glacialis]
MLRVLIRGFVMLFLVQPGTTTDASYYTMALEESGCEYQFFCGGSEVQTTDVGQTESGLCTLQGFSLIQSADDCGQAAAALGMLSGCTPQACSPIAATTTRAPGCYGSIPDETLFFNPRFTDTGPHASSCHGGYACKKCTTAAPTPFPTPTLTPFPTPFPTITKTVTRTSETGTGSATSSTTSTTETGTSSPTSSTTSTTEAGTSSAASSTTATTDMVLTATTVLVSSVLAGSQELVVESEEGFSAGDAIVITGGGNSETRNIASFGSIVLDAPLDYGYPAGSSITKLGGSYSSIVPLAVEQQYSEGKLAVIAGAAIVLLACVALGLGCLMRRGRSCCARGPAHDRGMRDAQMHQPDQKAELLENMDFWFLPVEAFMKIPRNKPIPRHQVLRDAGLLVKRTMALEDVLAGRFVADTAALSHRWLGPGHFDPECSNLCELQDMLAKIPSIKFLWVDWVCAPQWHGGGRTAEEEEEFGLVVKNVLPVIFLGCTVIVPYERVYNQRFWPNVECWIATKMVTEDGLVPASEDRLRLKVHGIDSAKGSNCAFYVLDSWHYADAQKAIHSLSQKDIMVTNASDKEINLKVVASLDGMIRSRYMSV